VQAEGGAVVLPGPATPWPLQVKLIAVAEALGAAARNITVDARERKANLVFVLILSLLGGHTLKSN